MNESPHGTTESHRHGLTGFIDWLNQKLYRPLGPPPVGPYTEVIEQVGASTCPVCGEPMSSHRIDHSTTNAVLHCPAPPLPLPKDEPVSEFGMKKPRV